LALQDRPSLPALTEAAAADADHVAASASTAVSLRLQGVERARAYFNADDGDPRVCRLMISNYNGFLKLDAEDIRFLLQVVEEYADKARPWIESLDEDIWANGLYLAANALASDAAVSLWASTELAKERRG
jgi:hypothetical protein